MPGAFPTSSKAGYSPDFITIALLIKYAHLCKQEDEITISFSLINYHENDNS